MFCCDEFCWVEVDVSWSADFWCFMFEMRRSLFELSPLLLAIMLWCPGVLAWAVMAADWTLAETPQLEVAPAPLLAMPSEKRFWAMPVEELGGMWSLSLAGPVPAACIFCCVEYVTLASTCSGAALACLRFSSDVLLRWRFALEAVLGAPTRACGSVLGDALARIAAS